MSEQTELSSPPAALDEALRTTARMFEARRVAAPDHVAFRVIEEGPDGAPSSLRDVTTEEFAAQAENAACLLAERGVQPGDRVLIMGRTSFAWAVADFACWYAGAVVVPLYPGSPATRLREAIEVVGAAAVLTEAGDPALTDGVPAGMPRVDLAELAAAPAATERQRSALRERWEAVSPADAATVVMTSGTTGEPRPVLITHANLTGVAQSIGQEYARFLHEGASTVILLPLAHILARGLQLVCVHAGMAITHLDDPSRVLPVLKLAKPTFLVVVPRVLDKVRERMRTLAARAKLGAVMRSAERLAVSRARREQAASGAGSRPASSGSVLATAGTALADRTIYALMRRLFGGRVQVLLSGAAALPAELGLFFQGAGLPVIQGYGLTETTAPAAGQRWGALRAGAVGPPVPGTTIRIAADGEVLVKGPGVCAGYGVDPKHAESATDAEGFFATGDLGRLEDGQLVITGRKKDLITTAYGKTVSPARWQDGMERAPEVEHAMAVGEGRPFLLGVVLLGSAGTGVGAPLEPLGAAPTDLRELSERLGSEVAQPERVRSLLVLRGGIDEDPELVTRTGKLRAGALRERLAELIDAEYARLGAER
ncbi:long-chain fatty acid--CoA ligase [Galactobacter valiniphilus]|uniref:Long-chain fatty acid--CoA ligase n=1 Tax=Galactobacter valiniphilus TaxID=2676122 RepID=A0A399JGK9_9MICC|nr:AMP-binding protein [Galactobacter valiniphilus]RII43329.1 long-chain fatty acid--CoA ligase [Galactobacter valiniphilus]